MARRQLSLVSWIKQSSGLSNVLSGEPAPSESEPSTSELSTSALPDPTTLSESDLPDVEGCVAQGSTAPVESYIEVVSDCLKLQ